MNLALNFIVVVATVLGSWMAFPQARRIARTRRVDGVSPTWIGVSLAINGWWLTYGLVVGIWALIPVSIVSLVLYAVMAWCFVRSVGRPALAGMAIGVFGLGMVPLPFLLVGGWELAGVAVGLSYGVQLLPAVVASLRTTALSACRRPPGSSRSSKLRCGWCTAWASLMSPSRSPARSGWRWRR
jgi:uncharacterized protein with PQ loop repeat